MSAGGGAPPLRSAVVAVGEELLLGRTLDTNGAWLGRRLAELGAPVVSKRTVGDDDEAIQEALAAATRVAEVVVFSGGLGPTADDRTRPAVAAGLGLALHPDAQVRARLEELYRKRGYDRIPPANEAQIQVPEGATVLMNPLGTAPGLVVRGLGSAPGAPEPLVALLPGVPRELRALFPGVAEAVRSVFGDRLRPVHVRTLHTTGIPESVLAPQVDEVMRGAPEGVELAYLPDLTGVDLRLTMRDRSDAEAEAALDAAEDRLEPVLRPYRLRSEGGDAARAVLDALGDRGWTVGLGESCTGGLVAKRLTDLPGASRVLAGGVVAYANEAKIRHLGVPSELIETHGAVSEPVARAMAQGAAAAFDADCGVGITGVAGPGGGTEAKPVGTVEIAVAVEGRITARRWCFSGDREAIRIRAAQAALAMLLAEIDPSGPRLGATQ